MPCSRGGTPGDAAKLHYKHDGSGGKGHRFASLRLSQSASFPPPGVRVGACQPPRAGLVCAAVAGALGKGDGRG